MNYTFDFLALFTSCLALYFIVRAKRTYFLDSGFFIGLANIGFIVYLAEATFSDMTNAPVSVPVDSLLIAVMGSSIGMASYLLRNSDQRIQSGVSELKGFLSKPPLPFLVFLAMVWVWTLSLLMFQPWALNQLASGGATIYYYTYPNWFIAASVILLAMFIGLPVLSFYRKSRTAKGKTVSLSMKIISLCWAMFAVSLFFQVAAGGFVLPGSQSVGFLVDSFLFVLISFALREPTILARIITAGEMMSQVVSSPPELDTIVLYNTESDRRKLVETFVKEGVANHQKVACLVTKAEVPFYRAVLKGPDLVEPSDDRHQVTVKSIDTPLTSIPDNPSRAELSAAQRELVDLDELDVERCREIISRLTSSDTPLRKARAGRIWALNVEGAEAGVLDILTARNPGARIIDLARQQDTFSALLGLKHHDIVGNRLLLEYEPTSDYEGIVQKFVREFQANVESVAIFTNAGSPIYRMFSEQRNIRLFTFSTKTSTPSRISNEQVLLPERDTSLLLDAVDKLLQAHSGRRIGIVFEVFTYLILSLGFEKAYSVISSVVEMVESEQATILVLVNSDALEARVLGGMRGLFQSQLLFNSEGLKTVRLTGEEYQKAGSASESVVSTEEPARRIEV